MAKYRNADGNEVDAVRLLWDAWDEVCALAGVGNLVDGKPEGCFVGHNGSEGAGNMGLIIPRDDMYHVACEGDYVFRSQWGTLFSMQPDTFEARYEAV